MGREGDTPAKNFWHVGVKKKWYKLSKLGGGRGEVIWTKYKRTATFFGGNRPSVVYPRYKVNWWAPAITVVDVEHHDRDILVLVVELPRLVVELRLHLQIIGIKLVFSSILETRLKRVVVVKIICPLLSRESWSGSEKSSPTNRTSHSRLRNKFIFAFVFMYLSL